LAAIEVPSSILERSLDYCLSRREDPVLPLPEHGELAAFEQALALWAQRYRIARVRPAKVAVGSGVLRPGMIRDGLRVEPWWVLDVARETRIAGVVPDPFLLTGAFPLSEAHKRMEPWTPNIVHAAWPRAFNPFRETVESYVAAAREHARERLREVKAEGWMLALRYTPEHLVWMVRWRLRRESPRVIAAEVNEPEARVRQAVRRLATSLELPPLSERSRGALGTLAQRVGRSPT
jgi:hypothetical protein